MHRRAWRRICVSARLIGYHRLHSTKRSSVPMLDHIATLDYAAAEVVAGAFALADGRLAVGTYGGWALFDAATLSCLHSDTSLVPKGCSVTGIHFDGDDVIMLGYRRAQTFETPANWYGALMRARAGSNGDVIHELPAGNWRMVGRRSGDQVILYDVSEGQGVYSFRSRGDSWSLPIAANRAVPAPGCVLCLGDERYIVVSLDGVVVTERALPDLHRYCWTTLAAEPTGRVVLGGFHRSSRAYALAVVDDQRSDPCMVESDLIFHVGRIEPIGADRYLLALGGGGEQLGACDGAGAVALVSTAAETATWQSQVLDRHDGISGMQVLPDNRVVCDFCGDLRVYSFGDG